MTFPPFAIARGGVLLFFAILATAETLIKMEISSATQRGALCNNFSPAEYYLRQAADPLPLRWVIHFEGGGGCSNFPSCNDRWERDDGRNRILMSSMDLPQSIEGEDLLSTDPDKNELFYNYSHVLVPHCSSDAWLANRTNDRVTENKPFRFNSSAIADNFVYKGQVILRAVLEDLVERGLHRATDIVLVGTSAGGIGLLNNLEWIENLVPNASIRVIIDSAWFIGFNGHHVFQYSEEPAEDFHFSHPACRDFSFGYPCCTSPACLFSKGYLKSTRSPILLVSSLYDILTLESPLRNLLQEGSGGDQELLALFNGYGSVMKESLSQSFKIHPQLSVYAPSCSQHVHLATSSLWYPGGRLNATADGVYQGSVFQVTNPILSGNWERVSVTSNGGSLTLLDALQLWTQNASKQLFLTDECSGPACSKCPSSILVTPKKYMWSTGYNYLVLALSALMTLVPIAIKLSAYLYMEYLLYRQKVFAYNMSVSNRKKPRFPKPTHAVNVSCIQLSYHIGIVGGGEIKCPDPQSVDRKQFTSSQHYHEHARMELFLPCYKRLCSKYFIKWRLRQNRSQKKSSCNGGSQTDLATHRPDSGISSEVTTSPVNHHHRDTEQAMESSSTNFDTTSLLSNGGNTWVEHLLKSRKAILNQVNMYINPGELVAIMGPSGSGKTTLLDVLLNKRTTGTIDGEILINGTRLSKMRRWFTGNTGYVRQLASYYYTELTVRENLLFSMTMQAWRGMSLKQKLERVEQVIREMGLEEQADIVVGDTATGLGLSGGQRKRLAIAVQLLSVPNILFLDEPTSGLDSASSLEILKSLQVLAETGRAVVVTIHQPRSEIFLAFDKILLLCKGQVAFFGSPVKVWDFFSQALEIEDELQSNGGNSSNMADRILDLLKEKRRQQKVLKVYRNCGEPERVRNAVERGKDNSEHIPLPLDSRYPGFWHRFVSLEARASLRQNIFTVIYLPIVYLVFGAVLGTTYLFTDTPVQIMSVTCLLSCSSSLFMSSIILSLLLEPLKLFQLEHSDGISNAYELTLQVFIRMSAVCSPPLAICASIVFVLVYQNYTLGVYFTVLLTFLLVNQCWLCLFILFAVLYPQQAHRLCPVFAAVGGFCCGFIVPKPLMPAYYRWIFYINPSYYAYAATSVTVLNENDLGCSRDSPLECFRDSNFAVLHTFGLTDVNPIESMVVLMGMVWVLLLLATCVLHLKVTIPVLKEKGKAVYSRLTTKKCQTRVHSTELTSLKINSTTSVTMVSNGNPPTYDSLIELENVDTTLDRESQSSTATERPVSTDLLLDGRHSLVMTFPWEKPQSVDESDFHPPPSILPSPPSIEPQDGPARNARNEDTSVSAEVRRVKRRRSRRKKETVVQITMEEEEEGMDDEERHRIAEQKWQQRRSGIETELLRLKHSQENRERARRYSDIRLPEGVQTDQQRRSRRMHSSHTGLHTKGSSSTSRLPRAGNRSDTRSLSGLARDTASERGTARGGRGREVNHWRNRLGSHEEVDEEDGENFELPPKDVPDFEPRFREAPPTLDMSQIPVEEISMVPEIGSLAPWNTGGGQESQF